MRLTNLGNILARLYAKASNGLPLRFSDEEAAFLISQESRFSSSSRTLLQRLNSGTRLSQVLSEAGHFPETYCEIIRAGEKSGKIAEALKVACEGLPLLVRFRYGTRAVFLYTFLYVMIAVLFVAFYSAAFSGQYGSIFGNDPSHLPALYRPLYVMGNTYGVQLLVLLFIALSIVFRKSLERVLLSRIPPLAATLDRMRFLEIVSLYRLYRSCGSSPGETLERLVSGISDPMAQNAIKRSVVEINNGTHPSLAIGSVSGVLCLSAFGVIAVAESTSVPLASLDEFISYTRNHLSDNLEREMRNVLRWASLVCGIVVALAVCYVFNAIIYSYRFVEMAL